MFKHNNFLNSCITFFQSSLLSGILVILPFTLTIGLFMISFRIIMAWIRPIQSFVAHPFYFVNSIEFKLIFSQLLLVLVLIFISGLIIRVLFLDSLIKQLEELLFKLPLVKPVYTGIKQLVHAFSVQDKISFKRVVIVEFPRPGIYSIGFLTGQLPTELAPEQNKKFYNVFIPTTPNPTTGFLVVIPEDQLKTLHLSHQEAMGLIISGGIIQPERFIK